MFQIFQKFKSGLADPEEEEVVVFQRVLQVLLADLLDLLIELALDFPE